MLALILSFLIQRDIPEGSVIFLKNSSVVISWYTGSSVTHAAIILKDSDGKLCVYEATMPVVRRVFFEEYLKTYPSSNPLLPANKRRNVQICIAIPEKPYSEEEIGKMGRYLESQVGKDYSVFKYFKGSAKNLHCTEYVVRALISSGRYSIKDFGENDANKIPPKMLQEVLTKTYKFSDWYSQKN